MANETQNDLGILIGFVINEVAEVKNINEAIKRIEEKISKLNISFNIDTEALKKIQEIIREVNKVGSDNFDKLTQGTQKATLASEEHERQLREEARAVDEVAQRIENLRRIVQIRTPQRGVLVEQVTTGDRFEYTTQTTRFKEKGVSVTFTDIIDQEKLDEARKSFENFADDFVKRIAKVDEVLGSPNEKIRSLVDEFEKLDERSSKADLSRITKQLKELEAEASQVQFGRTKLSELEKDFTQKMGTIEKILGSTNEKVKKLHEEFGRLNEYSKKADFSRITKQLKELEAEANQVQFGRTKLSELEKDFRQKMGTIEKILGPTNEKVRKLHEEFGRLNEYSKKADFSRVSKELNRLSQEATKLDAGRVRYENFAYTFTEKIGYIEKILGPTNEKVIRLHEAFGRLSETSRKLEFDRVRRELNKLEKEAKDLENFSKQTDKIKADIADIRRRFGADPGVAKSLDQLEEKLKGVTRENYKEAFENINTELKKIKANAQTARSHVIGLGEALRTAFVKFPVWLVSGTVIMQSVRFFQYGIRYAIELDSKLNEIAIVLGKNQEEVRALALEYNELAKQMGVTTRQIAEASVEFYRQGLTQEEVMERLKTTTQYAKISSLEFKDAAEILTATVNSMGVDIERASDVFAYLGGIRPLAS